jgi:hypothetical protein
MDHLLVLIYLGFACSFLCSLFAGVWLLCGAVGCLPVISFFLLGCSGHFCFDGNGLVVDERAE